MENNVLWNHWRRIKTVFFRSVFFWTLLSGVILDQLIKLVVFANLNPLIYEDSVSGLSGPAWDFAGFFRIQAHFNQGWNLGVPGVARVELLGLASLLFCLIFLVIYCYRPPRFSRLNEVSIGLFVAGAFSNGIDRVVLGGVRDYFRLLPHASLPLGLSWPNGGKVLFPAYVNLADGFLLWGLLTFGRLIMEQANPKVPPN